MWRLLFDSMRFFARLAVETTKRKEQVNQELTIVGVSFFKVSVRDYSCMYEFEFDGYSQK